MFVTCTPRMPKMMKNVQQMRTMFPMGRSDDSSVCTTSLRPGARLITLHIEYSTTTTIVSSSISTDFTCDQQLSACQVINRALIQLIRQKYRVQRRTDKTRKCGNYSDVLPLKAARRDSISNLTSFGPANLNCR